MNLWVRSCFYAYLKVLEYDFSKATTTIFPENII